MNWKYFLTAVFSIFSLSTFAKSVEIYSAPNIPAIQFATGDLRKALKKQGMVCQLFPLGKLHGKKGDVQIIIGLAKNEDVKQGTKSVGINTPQFSSPESYSIQLSHNDNQPSVWAIGSDAAGAMYAGLSLAETFAQEGIEGIKEEDCRPHLEKRGPKINVPLDARTPAYADCGDAAQQNMGVMWEMELWKAHLDQMARYRYNAITMWNAHPFPSMVKVPEYPDVALEDVMIADIDWMEWFPKNAGFGGSKGVTEDILENLKVIKKMTMEDKIRHWQEVMRYAHHQGIEFHIITWNIFTWGTNGKYGITHNVDNEITIDYLRKSVKSLFETYPLLAGIGVTAGEHMPSLTPREKEQWLWKTYGLGVMDAKQAFPGRKIRLIHRYWMSKIPDMEFETPYVIVSLER